MQEERETRTPDLRELQEEASSLKSLKNHLGYKRLMEHLNGQVTARREDIILKPLPSVDAALGQEYAKGECAGLMLAIGFLDGHLEALIADIETQLEALEKENARSKSNTSSE